MRSWGQEGSRAGTLFQYCRFRWRILESQCSKGWEPVSSLSEKEATVIRIKSKILSVGLGTWRCNETMTTEGEGPAANRHLAGLWYYRLTRHARQEKPLQVHVFIVLTVKCVIKRGYKEYQNYNSNLKLKHHDTQRNAQPRP